MDIGITEIITTSLRPSQSGGHSGTTFESLASFLRDSVETLADRRWLEYRHLYKYLYTYKEPFLSKESLFFLVVSSLFSISFCFPSFCSFTALLYHPDMSSPFWYYKEEKNVYNLTKRPRRKETGQFPDFCYVTHFNWIYFAVYLGCSTTVEYSRVYWHQINPSSCSASTSTDSMSINKYSCNLLLLS